MIKVLDIKNRYTVTYKDAEYPCVEALISTDGSEPYIDKFGSTSLSKKIIDANGTPKDSSAKKIDDELYGYVNDDAFTECDESLARTIETELD